MIASSHTESPVERHLLAVSWEMPPLSGPRAVQVTRTLVHLGAHGWHSRVICFGATSRRYLQDFDIDVEHASGGRVQRYPVPSPEEWLLFRALWRICPPVKQLPDEKSVWRPGAIAEGRRLIAERRPHVIVSFAQPWTNHLVALALHREYGIPWIAHFSDPWVDNPYASGAQWQLRVWRRMEAAVVAEATRLVFVNDYTLSRIMAKYPDHWRARASVVTQGFERRAPAHPAQTTAPRPMRMVYTGRFYHGVRTPDAFLRALSSLDQSEPLRGRLVVEFVGHDMNRYQARAAELGLAGVAVFEGRLDPPAARERASRADVLLSIDAPSDGASLFLPSKLVDYLALDRPILALTPREGAPADLIRELGYFAAPPDDVEAIARVVADLLHRHAAGTLSSSPSHAAVAGRFDIRETTRAFARVLAEAAAGT